MKIILPYPVSANRYWSTFPYIDRATKKPKAVTVPTAEAKAFKQEAAWRAKEAGYRVPLTGPVELRISLVPKNRVCMDLDNALKVTIDALKGVVYADDAQVYRIVAERLDADPTGARLEVEALALTLPTELERAGGMSQRREFGKTHCGNEGRDH